MLGRLVFIALAMVCSAATLAAQFPDKIVRLVVPFAPGGNTDHLTRIFAEGLSAKWKQTVIVENKPGGGATIGAARVANSQPDGYTLLLGSVGMATNQFLFKKMPYPAESLVPLALVAQGPNVLFVNPSLPVSNVADLIRYAKERPGKLTFASSGIGTSPHLAAELFAARAGIDIVHVPYKGANPAANDLIGGQVDAFFSVLNLMPYVAAGKIRALAVSTEQRIPEVPTLPTVDESGMTKGVVSGTWFGFFAPADVPADVKQTIVQGLTEVAQDKKTQEKIAGLSLSPAFLGTDEFTSFIKAEEDRWGEVIRKQNITLN